MFVKAIRTHIQPGTMVYREEGDKFEHDGKLYQHVEVVKPAAKSKQAKDAETSPEQTGPEEE